MHADTAARMRKAGLRSSSAASFSTMHCISGCRMGSRLNATACMLALFLALTALRGNNLGASSPKGKASCTIDALGTRIAKARYIPCISGTSCISNSCCMAHICVAQAQRRAVATQ